MIDLTLDTNTTHVHAPESPKAVRRELLRPLPEADEYLLVLDNTAAEKWMMCPTMAKYYLFDRREGHARNAALTFGGAVHEGLEVLLRGPQYERWLEGHNNIGESIETEQELLARAAQTMQTFWQENPAPPDEYRTLNNAIEVLVRYSERARLPDYQWTPLSDTHGLLIERAFELPLGVLDVDTQIQLPEWNEPRHVNRIHVAWAGRIDLVANAHGRNRVCDHKTTSIAGDNFVQDFFLSNQTQGYVWAARQLWSDLSIDGFCLNAIHLNKPSAGKGISEPGPRGGPPALNFFRAYYEYSDERLKEWEYNALTLVEDFVHCLVRDSQLKADGSPFSGFPLHTKQCFNKYGRCNYHDVCTIDDKSVRDTLIYSDAYKDVTWNPTTGR